MLDNLLTLNVASPAVRPARETRPVGPTETKSAPHPAPESRPPQPVPSLSGVGAVVAPESLVAAQEAAQAQGRPSVLDQRQQQVAANDDGGAKAAAEQARVQELYQRQADSDLRVREQLQHEAETRADSLKESDRRASTNNQPQTPAPDPNVERDRAIAAYSASGSEADSAPPPGVVLSQQVGSVDLLA